MSVTEIERERESESAHDNGNLIRIICNNIFADHSPDGHDTAKPKAGRRREHETNGFAHSFTPVGCALAIFISTQASHFPPSAFLGGKSFCAKRTRDGGEQERERKKTAEDTLHFSSTAQKVRGKLLFKSSFPSTSCTRASAHTHPGTHCWRLLFCPL